MDIGELCAHSDSRYRTWLVSVFGPGAISDVYSNSNILIGFTVSEDLSIIGKEMIAHNKIKLVHDMILSIYDSDISKYLPKPLERMDISQFTKLTTLPPFTYDKRLATSSLGDICVENSRYSTGSIKVNALRYVLERGATELNPKFLVDPLYLVWLLISVFNDVYSKELKLLGVLKKWFQVCCRDPKTGHFFNPVRLSSGKIVAWSTDSHYLKRLSVIINTLTVAVSQHLLISVVPTYLDILDDVACNFFLDVDTYPRAFKRMHGTFSLEFGVRPKDRNYKNVFAKVIFSPSKYEYLRFKSNDPRVETFTSGEHRHHTYSNLDLPHLNPSTTYYEPKKCGGCKLNDIMGVIWEVKKDRLLLALKEVRVDISNAYGNYVDLMLYDTECELTVLLANGYSQLLTIGGFQETNKLLDIGTTYDEAKEFRSTITSDKLDDNFKLTRRRFQSNLKRAYTNLMQQSVSGGLLYDTKMFNRSIASMVTGNSAGMGSYSLNLGQSRLTFTDKRFVMLIEGINLLNISSDQLITESSKQWRLRVRSSSPAYTDEYIDNNIQVVLKTNPIKQRSIGVRAVPGGRAIRAIYIEPLIIYLLEKLVFPYVEVFKYGNQPVDSRVDIFVNEFDCGTFNAKVKMDNSEEAFVTTIMQSGNGDRLIYWMDYTQFDMTESYQLFRKFKYDGVLEFLNGDAPRWTKEPYVVIDNVPANLSAIVNLLRHSLQTNYYYLRDGPCLREFLVDYLTSGAYETFDDNTINNSEVTRILSEHLKASNYTSSGIVDAVIAGDDNVGIINVTKWNKDVITGIITSLADIPRACGLKVNANKSSVGLTSFEMAKIGVSRGFVFRVGNTQLFESEKESRAESVTEIMRGLANKFLLYKQRHPVETNAFNSLMLGAMIGGHKLDITGKSGSGDSRRRLSLHLNSFASLIPAVTGGGIGAPIHGSFIGDGILTLFDNNLVDKFLFNFMVTQAVKYKFMTKEVDDISKDIMLTVMSENGVSRYSKYYNPQGVLIHEPFKGMRDLIRVPQSRIRDSDVAYNKLKSFGFVLPERNRYKNVSQSLIDDSVRSALVNRKVKYLDHTDLLQRLSILNYDRKTIMGQLMIMYPILTRVVPSMAELSDVSISVMNRDGIRNPARLFNFVNHVGGISRYPTMELSLWSMYSYFGHRRSVRRNSAHVLKPYNDVIRAAKRLGIVNPSVTEEVLRDIIADATMQINAVGSRDVVSAVIASIFGPIPGVDDYVDRIMRDSWGFESTKLGYSWVGSSFLNLFVDTNMASFHNEGPSSLIHVDGCPPQMRQLASELALMIYHSLLARHHCVPSKLRLIVIKSRDLNTFSSIVFNRVIPGLSSGFDLGYAPV